MDLLYHDHEELIRRSNAEIAVKAWPHLRIRCSKCRWLKHSSEFSKHRNNQKRFYRAYTCQMCKNGRIAHPNEDVHAWEKEPDSKKRRAMEDKFK